MMDAIKHELERNNALLALLIQVVVESHGGSIKYREKLEELMKDD